MLTFRRYLYPRAKIAPNKKVGLRPTWRATYLEAIKYMLGDLENARRLKHAGRRLLLRLLKRPKQWQMQLAA